MICLLEACALRVPFCLTVMIPGEFICCVWWFKQVIYTQEIPKMNKPKSRYDVSACGQTHAGKNSAFIAVDSPEEGKQHNYRN